MGAATRLRAGDRSPRVRAVRTQLLHSGDLPADPLDDAGVPSDLFDPALDQAVRSFQQRRGLLVDGVVGPQTSRALDGSRWRLGDRILRHTPGHLVSGDDVSELQERLMALGFFSGRVDGVLGEMTEQALRELQHGVGLDPDGTCGPHTLRALASLARTVGGGNAHALRERSEVTTAGASVTGRVIVLDPAHEEGEPPRGGKELRGHGLSGHEVAYDLVRRVEGRLAAIGVTTVLTHSARHSPSVAERAALAADVRADLLVSISCESQPGSSAHGVATYFWGDDRISTRSAVGERLADLVQREVVARTDLLDCRSHPRTWDLLRFTPMPAVQIACGYLSHPGDALRLADPAFRDTLAEAVVAAIRRLYLPEDEDVTTGSLQVSDVLAAHGSSER